MRNFNFEYIGDFNSNLREIKNSRLDENCKNFIIEKFEEDLEDYIEDLISNFELNVKVYDDKNLVEFSKLISSNIIESYMLGEIKRVNNFVILEKVVDFVKVNKS